MIELAKEFLVILAGVLAGERIGRWIEKLPDGIFREEMADLNECAEMYNEVCCCPDCGHCAGFPDPEEDCKRCAFFKPEGGQGIPPR